MIQRYFDIGDLVEIDFGYNHRSVGLFVKYHGPHDAGWESRGIVMIDGEHLPIPIDQIGLIRKATKNDQ